MYPVGIDFYLIGVNQIESYFNATTADVHYAFSIYLLGMASTMIFAGALSDKVGRKPFALGGCIIYIGACLTAGWSESTLEFLLSRLLQGVGAGFCYVMCFSIIRDALPEAQRVKVLTVINGITCTIPVVAPAIGSLLLIWFNWQSLFFIMAVLGLFPLLLTSFVFNETQKPPVNISASINKQEKRLAEFTFVSRLIISALGVMSILTYVNVSPILLMSNLRFSTNEYAIAMSLLASVSMLTSFTAPTLIQKYGQRSLLFITQLFYFNSSDSFMN